VGTEAGDTVVRCDVAVIGGGAAGLAGALLLGRSRRSVVVIDAGEPRNAPAAHIHGYLGHDGLPPAELLSIGREEVRRYGVDVIEGCRGTVSRLDTGGFRVDVSNGAVVLARRVLVATGLVDVLPDIAGLAEQWGRGVIHCPYCHGWEVRDQPLVVIDTGSGAHQVGLFRQLSPDVTLVVHDGAGPDAEMAVRLASRGVEIVREPVAEVLSDSHDDVTGVRLVSGRVLPAGAVVVGPRFVARSEAVSGLGIVAVPDPMGFGEVIATDSAGQTAVTGVYAAGNVTDVRAQVLQAAAAGAVVGAAINAGLVVDDTSVAVTARAVLDEWDRRYGDHTQMWTGRPNDVLLTEIPGLSPGRALDVGCGEGADAIWLASQGWTATGLDVSQVALDRAAVAAGQAGVSVDWVCADIAARPPATGGYDLVSVQYPALRHTPAEDAIRGLLDAVAPGGTLLVVGHAPLVAEYARAHGFEPTDYVQPADVAARLDGTWDIEINETRPRLSPPPHDSPYTHNSVLRARRRP
jgi:thioredoxin reductase/SAM-dependent methyltransferase